MRARIVDFRPSGFRKWRIALETNGDLRGTVDRLKGQDVDLTIEKYSESRSAQANSYLWALITKIGNALRESKENIYFDMLKEYGQGGAASVKERYREDFERSYKYHEYLGESTLNGERFYHYRFWVGSSKYSREEFTILLDGVVQEAKNLGIEVRSEEEIESMLGELPE